MPDGLLVRNGSLISFGLRVLNGLLLPRLAVVMQGGRRLRQLQARRRLDEPGMPVLEYQRQLPEQSPLPAAIALTRHHLELFPGEVHQQSLQDQDLGGRERGKLGERQEGYSFSFHNSSGIRPCLPG